MHHIQLTKVNIPNISRPYSHYQHERTYTNMRLPRHIGIIPDGNRRWAVREGMDKADGYDHGIAPGMELFRMCRELGVEEMTFYGFTVDNTKRPSAQRRAFTAACVAAVEELSKEDASLLVLGNTKSSVFPREFLPYTTRRSFGKGGMKINFLVIKAGDGISA